MAAPRRLPPVCSALPAAPASRCTRPVPPAPGRPRPAADGTDSKSFQRRPVAPTGFANYAIVSRVTEFRRRWLANYAIVSRVTEFRRRWLRPYYRSKVRSGPATDGQWPPGQDYGGGGQRWSAKRLGLHGRIQGLGLHWRIQGGITANPSPPPTA